MNKASITLGKISRYLSVKVSLILDDPKEPQNQSKFPKIMQRYEISGNNYLTFAPRAYLTLEISKKSPTEQWSPNLSVNLNQRNLFLFIRILKRIILQIDRDKTLFQLSNDGRLGISKARAIEAARVMQCGPDKTIKLQPALVTNDNNPDMVAKGCIFFINTVDYYAFLTYEDLLFMYDMLSKVDLIDYGYKLYALSLRTTYKPNHN